MYKVEQDAKLESLYGSGYKDLKEKLGYSPIFCIPIRNKKELTRRIYLTYSSQPNNIIIFKSNNYNELDFIAWASHLRLLELSEVEEDSKFLKVLKESLKKKSDIIIDNKGSVYNEFIVPEINMKSVKNIVLINPNGVIGSGKGSDSDSYWDFVGSNKFNRLVDKLLPKQQGRILNTMEVSRDKNLDMEELIQTLRDNPHNITPDLFNKSLKFIEDIYFKES